MEQLLEAVRVPLVKSHQKVEIISPEKVSRIHPKINKFVDNGESGRSASLKLSLVFSRRLKETAK